MAGFNILLGPCVKVGYVSSSSASIKPVHCSLRFVESSQAYRGMCKLNRVHNPFDYFSFISKWKFTEQLGILLGLKN